MSISGDTPAPGAAPAAAVRGAERIAAAFANAPGKAALMPYLMGGFPDLAASRAIGKACAEAGAALVELGVPYSDPLADGPVIHAAGTAALAAGARVDDVFEVAAALERHLPVVLMCYANLVYARGLEAFAADAAAHGVSGLIVPDLPLQEAPAVRSACDASGIALVGLVAPTSSDERLAAIGAQSRGFIYAVSVAGTTGERTAVGDSVGDLVRRAGAGTQLPVAVGFGIGTPEQARAVADAGAQGVIIGSRLVRAASEAVEQGHDPAAAVGELVADFAAALNR